MTITFHTDLVQKDDKVNGGITIQCTNVEKNLAMTTHDLVAAVARHMYELETGTRYDAG